jgi:hypothetical protein
MGIRIQVFSTIGALFLLAVVFELIRRRKLKERYSLLWLLTGFVVLAFALKRNLIDILGRTLGIAYSPAALLLVVTLFFILILLHFSTVISELSDRNRKLAQRLAILEWRMRNLLD